jgi:phospholipid/cholesterol/gamma-HCH transport system substrate-binding protein
MEERRKQFMVGIVVFSTIIISIVLILMSSDFSWSPFRKQYQLQVLVDQAPGVAPDTPVRRRGILIGRVASVTDTDTGALITLNIDDQKQIKSNEVARIQTSLIGDAVIDFSPLGPAADSTVVQPGGPPLRGMYNPSPLDLLANLQGDLKITIQSLGDAGQQVAELAEKVNTVLGDADMERLSRVMESADSALTNFSAVMADVRDVVGDEQFKSELKRGLAQLPQVVSDAREILAVLERTLASADKNLQNLQGLTGPLGERGPQLVERLEQSISNLSSVFAEAALFAKSINTSEGTIGRLIRERELYDKLGNTVNEAQSAIRDVRIMINDEYIQMRIRQILENVRVLTDKLARDPARIARGIIPSNRETPLK